ncbi:MAG: hypothetical protein V4747_17695 [Pseudomonadota bacterium]
MAEYKVDGAELKKMVKLARKGPIPFAFNPGSGEETAYLGMHRKKSPQMIAKEAKEEGEGSKHTFGTFLVDGNVARIQCERELSGVAKKLKKFLKANKVNLNVQVLDPDGNVLESDIEEGLPVELDADDDVDDTAEDEKEETASEETTTQTSTDTAADRLRQALATLETRIDELADGGPKAKLQAALRVVDGFLTVNETEKVLAGIKQLQQALVQAASAGPSAEETKWDQIQAAVEAKVLAALKANGGDSSKIRAVWTFAQEKAEAGDFVAAMKAVTNLLPLLKDVGAHPDTAGPQTEAATTPANERPPVGVVAFQRSRIMWLDAKSKMKAEIDRLRATIVADGADEEDAAEIASGADELVAEYQQFDSRLEDVLDEITQTPEGPARTALKRQASRVITEYDSVLSQPFFKMVDANPFGGASVTEQARQSLRVIQKTLA